MTDQLRPPTNRELLIEGLALACRDYDRKVRDLAGKINKEYDPVVKTALGLGLQHYKEIVSRVTAMKCLFQELPGQLETPEQAVAALRVIEQELEE